VLPLHVDLQLLGVVAQQFVQLPSLEFIWTLLFFLLLPVVFACVDHSQLDVVDGADRQDFNRSDFLFGAGYLGEGVGSVRVLFEFEFEVAVAADNLLLLTRDAGGEADEADEVRTVESGSSAL
jgi:hypothetical protein